jgi:hypothetical protein
MTNERRGVYGVEWVRLHNEQLARHPKARLGMEYIAMAPSGALIMNTPDKVVSDADLATFAEVSVDVARTHRLIIP